MATTTTLSSEAYDSTADRIARRRPHTHRIAGAHLAAARSHLFLQERDGAVARLSEDTRVVQEEQPRKKKQDAG